MKRKIVESMPAGKEIDTLIAKSLGYRVEGNIVIFPDGDHSYLVPDLGGYWSPSQDIGLAMYISEMVGEYIGKNSDETLDRGINFLTLCQLNTYAPVLYAASFDCCLADEWHEDYEIDKYPFAARGETAPLAICRAFLLVKAE